LQLRRETSDADTRECRFTLALQGSGPGVRYEIPRRDFAAIEGSPLAYHQIGIVAHIFRENPATENLSETYQGVIIRPDEPHIRYFWEIYPVRDKRPWVTLHKGGDFSRFYFDANLVIDWSDCARRSFHRLRDPRIYFKAGLTWPRRTQRGFNMRRLPAGCVFSDKGPAIFFHNHEHEGLFLAAANSKLAEFILHALMSFGSWELTAIRRFPLAIGTAEARERLADLANSIYEKKAAWDEGNETSTRFCKPWLLRDDMATTPSLTAALDRLSATEGDTDATIQLLYNNLNDEVYKLYGVPNSTRNIIENALGERPPELVWAHMEGKSDDQKRIEHVVRLLSYVVKRVVTASEDGIVPFSHIDSELDLVARVHVELAALFPDRDVGLVEAEIANELRKNVNGYRRTAGIGEWLRNAFFEFHRSLYKNTPVIWHIASSRGTAPFAFGALVDYHRFDRNRMSKLRSYYLREAIESMRRETAMADKTGNTEARLEWQTQLEEALDFDRRLQWVEEGHHEGREGGPQDYRVLIPWKPAEDRPKGWDPDLDDGVQVNITPLYKAAVLRLDG
jgi:hypothetical protein